MAEKYGLAWKACGKNHSDGNGTLCILTTSIKSLNVAGLPQYGLWLQAACWAVMRNSQSHVNLLCPLFSRAATGQKSFWLCWVP